MANYGVTKNGRVLTAQWMVIEEHLKEYGSITSWQAIKDYGFTRLSHLIYVLRRRGMEIKRRDVAQKNRYGVTVNFGEYYV